MEATAVANKLWVEKYRPKSLDEMVMAKAIKEKFKEMLDEGEIPQLLLHGKAGTGKTSLARILMASLDCDTLELNSSMDRGIDTIRNKINNFVVMRGMHKWRIVLLEEMDGLTKDAMQAIRNLMEQYSGRARFILTCNYVNRIIEPIQSRCQMVEFRELAKKDCFKRLSKILEAEGVTFDPDRVIQITDLLYPDLRSMINLAQLSVKAKKLDKIVEDFSDTLTVMDLIKGRKLDDIRGVCYRLEFPEMYRYLFDHIDQIEGDKIRQTEKRLRIAEYLYRDSYIADREINFMACVLEVM